MNKYLCVLLATSFLGVSCKKKYNEGFDAGYTQGYDETYSGAYSDGLSDGEAQGAVDGYSNGYTDGNDLGYDEGYDQAYNDFASDDYQAGFETGNAIAYDLGFETGSELGYQVGVGDGILDGEADGYAVGYDIGYSNGYSTGYDSGYSAYYDDGYYAGDSAGYSSGYSSGYSAGEADRPDDSSGYGSSFAANIRSVNPSVQLAMNVNADLVDYASLPKFDSSTSSTIAMNFADSGTVDLEKLAALKEQHYLKAIQNQLELKFGLSQSSAIKVASIAHQFNKIAGSRELTSEDASQFSKNLIGFDINEIETAVKKSMQGNSAELKELMNSASKNIGTSPEKFNSIITDIFY